MEHTELTFGFNEDFTFDCTHAELRYNEEYRSLAVSNIIIIITIFTVFTIIRIASLSEYILL